MAKGIYFLASSGSTVVEYQALDSEIKGLNNATFQGERIDQKHCALLGQEQLCSGRIVTIWSINLIELIDAQVKRCTEHF